MPLPSVCFAFGDCDSGQLGTDQRKNQYSPCVLGQLLCVGFDASKVAAPLVAGSRNSLAVDAEGGVGAPTRAELNATFAATVSFTTPSRAFGIRIRMQSPLITWHPHGPPPLSCLMAPISCPLPLVRPPFMAPHCPP